MCTAHYLFLIMSAFLWYNHSMSKKKKARKRKQIRRKRIRISRSFIMPFILTLSIAVVLGLLALAAYQWVFEPARQVQSTMKPVRQPQTTGEMQGAEKEETKQAEQIEQIEQIEQTEEPGRYASQLNDPEYMAQNNISYREAGEPGQATLLFAGDILFDDHYAIMKYLQSGGGIEEGISPELIREMERADVMMLNNEFAYSDRGAPLEGKQFTFRARPETVQYLTDMGVDIVSLANNHAYDYGEEALLDTLDILKEAGVTAIGAGHNLEETRRPAYYIVDDIKIGFLTATQIERLDNPDTRGATDVSPGVFRCWDGANLLETIKDTKKNCDFLVVYLHWGTENEAVLDWAQLKQAPEVVQAGADLIIGDHPHCLQPIGVIQGVPVIYSLGNFWFNSKTLDTGMVKVVIDQEGLVSYQFIPCLQNGCRTGLLDGEEKSRVLQYMRSISEGVQIDEDGYVTW